MSEETVTFNLELDASATYSEMRKIELLFYRTLALAKRLGLPEDIQRQIAVIQRLVMVMRILHRAMMLLETASGPIGWALAIVAGATAVMEASDFMLQTGE